MKIGILGLGSVGRSFVDVLSRYGHEIFAYDASPDLMHGLPMIKVCEREEEVGENSDFLLCCTDMLSGYALTKAAKVMKPGTVVSGDFSAKTPEYEAFKDSGRLDDLVYYSIHTVFAPKVGFKDQLVIEIPVRNCTGKDGKENPYIIQFRDTLKAAGSRFKRLWSIQNHDLRMGRIQGAISAENICTAATLAELGVNPLTDTEIYSGKLDEAKFLMSLRAIGGKSSSNHRVYGLIAMMNPYSLANISAYADVLERVIETTQRSEREAIDMFEAARETLGCERVEAAKRLWDSTFGSECGTKNSFSSHLAEAILWAESEAPLEMFTETPSPPYRFRELMALKALSMYKQCVRNMRSRDTHDREFLETVKRYRDWAEQALKEKSWASIKRFKLLFFEPARKVFSKELENIAERTNELIKMVPQ